MRMLVLLPESPFPWASTASRYYGPLLKALDALEHQVSVLCVGGGSRGGDQPADYFERTSIEFTFIDPPDPRPFVERKLRTAWRADWELATSAFGRQARSLAGRGVDMVLAEHPSTARAVEGLRNVVCSLHCLQHIDLRAGTSLTDRRRRVLARRAERTTLERIGRARVVSQRLADLAQALAPGLKVSVVPLCLDLTLYEPVRPPTVPTVGFIGSMFWGPSRAAARRFVTRLVPLIQQRVPHARFLVAGWDAARYLREEAAAAQVDLIDSFRDPRAIFEQLTVLVNAPPVGTGMKVKVLEAMAYGVPVVANGDGAEGLEWDRQAPVRRADHDEEIAEAVVRILEDADQHAQLALAGRDCLARSFSPEPVAARLVVELARLVPVVAGFATVGAI